MQQDYGWGLFWLIFGGGVLLVITHPTVKILEQLPNKLIIRIRPTFFWGVALFFAGVGLFLLLSSLTLTPVTTLTCERSAPLQLSLTSIQDAPTFPRCELAEINWLGREKSKTFISELQGATTETKIRKDKHGITISTYRVMLQTSGGNVPFTNEYTAYDEQSRQALVFQINAFIQAPMQASLVVQENERLLGYFGFGIAGFFEVVSILVIAVAPVVTCFFDQESDSVTIRRHNWFGAKVFQHSLHEISGAKVELSNGGGLTFRVTLTLWSGKTLPLTRFYSSGSEEKQQVAIYIQKFLSLSSSRLECQFER